MTDPPPAAPGSRRFYTSVQVEAVDGAWHVRLDGRPVRSPKGAPLHAPTRALAAIIAAEWQEQGDTLHLAGMAMTRMAHTAADLTPEATAALAHEQARYASTDLLCYRAEAPAALTEHEAVAWDPWLAWAERELGAVLVVVEGITAVSQPADSLAAIRAQAAALEPFALTGLAYATALFGSAVLGFATQRGAIEAAEAYELSRLDEAWQEKHWGEDAEAAARTAARRRDARLIGDWFAALRA